MPIFSPNLPKNEFRVGNSESQYQNKNQHPQDSVFQFSGKTGNFDFSPICPKMDFEVESSKIQAQIHEPT